ncbi:MAG: CvpA family protein [Holosporales bacterium]|jgi:membrane protein required for colicin V production|nr:CvpA family protein [Holosporales bacterium]
MRAVDLLTADVLIVVVAALSFLIGWVRGATKEILSVIAWIGGIYLTITIFPYVQSFARCYIEHGLIADFLTVCALFIVFLTLLSVLNYFCSNIVKTSLLNTADKALGGMFGIARAVVILAVIDIAVNQFVTVTPNWLECSKLRQTISGVSNYLIILLPDDIQTKLLSHMSQIKKQNFLDFIRGEIIGNITQNLEDNKVTAVDGNKASEEEQEDVIEEKPQQHSETSGQSAEDLATLRPKKNSETDAPSKGITKMERNDLSRLIDQYDNVDE